MILLTKEKKFLIRLHHRTGEMFSVNGPSRKMIIIIILSAVLGRISSTG